MLAANKPKVSHRNAQQLVKTVPIDEEEDSRGIMPLVHPGQGADSPLKDSHDKATFTLASSGKGAIAGHRRGDGGNAFKLTKRIASETEAGIQQMVVDDGLGEHPTLMTIEGKTSNAFDMIATSSAPKGFKSNGSQRVENKKARTQMMPGIKGSFGLIELAQVQERVDLED